jgi:hypothetical protein
MLTIVAVPAVDLSLKSAIPTPKVVIVAFPAVDVSRKSELAPTVALAAVADCEKLAVVPRRSALAAVELSAKFTTKPRKIALAALEPFANVTKLETLKMGAFDELLAIPASVNRSAEETSNV